MESKHGRLQNARTTVSRPDLWEFHINDNLLSVYASLRMIRSVTGDDSTLPQLVSLLLLLYELRHGKDRGARVLQPKRR